VLNYLGQGALLMVQPEAVANPFYLAFPQWALDPMVALATAATVIASQATISGAYSMTQQAIQLGFLPRMAIRHTSSSSMGQIYVPAVNWILLLVVGATVVGFGSSSRLASAYGVAVMGTMLVTTMLTYFVLRDRWGYPAWLCMAATAAFGSVDLTLLAAALHKVLEGGWFPLVLAGVVFLLMTTWRRGRTRLMAQISASSPPLVEFLRSLFQCPPLRVPGTAVFLSASAEATPNALLHSLKHYKVLHARNVFLTVEFRDVAWVATEDRIACVPLPEDCWHVRARFGFMESPDVGLALARCGRAGLQAEPMEATYFLSRETIVPRSDGMAAWRERLFAALARNAGSIADFFNIPSNRVVELGTRVAL
jgi:KUP system potassium uptake protein